VVEVRWGEGGVVGWGGWGCGGVEMEHGRKRVGRDKRAEVGELGG